MGVENRLHHVTLLAENDNGVCNLVKLVHLSNSSNINGKPSIERADLAAHSGGLIGLSGCIGGEVPRKLLELDYKGALETALEYKAIFAPDCFFIEITTHGWVHNSRINPPLIEISKETGLSMVATNDAHMVCLEDARRFVTIRDELAQAEARKLYLMTEAEMLEQMSSFPLAEQAISNTTKIAERCNASLSSASRFIDPLLLPLITPLSAAPPIIEYVQKVEKLTAQEMQLDRRWVWTWKELSGRHKKKLHQAIEKYHAAFVNKNGFLPDKDDKRLICRQIKNEIKKIVSFPDMPDPELRRLVEKYSKRISAQIAFKEQVEAGLVPPPEPKKRRRRKAQSPGAWRNMTDEDKGRFSSTVRKLYDGAISDGPITEESVRQVIAKVEVGLRKIPIEITPKQLAATASMLVRRWERKREIEREDEMFYE